MSLVPVLEETYEYHMSSQVCPPSVQAVPVKSPSSGDDARLVPVVSREGNVVALHFGSEYIQSQMVIGDPDFLALAYTRAMMAFEVFLPGPREITVIGLGGGSIAKWCHRHHPQARLTVVEINPHVIAVGDAFAIPPLSPRFRIFCEDGAKFVADPPVRSDVLLVDCCTTDRLPPELCSKTFFDNCRNALTESGLMVVNLCWGKHAAIIARIRKSFGGQILLSSDKDGNTVVYACSGKLLWPADEDEHSFRLKLRKFERKYKLGKAMAPQS
jgi:spermidine synthase